MAYAAPTVVTDPATQAQTDTALVTLNTYVTALYTDAIALLQVARENIRLRQGSVMALEALDSLGGVFGSPGNTNPTTSTNPVTQADGNATFAVLIGYIDTFITRFNAAIGVIRANMKLSGGHEQIRSALDTALSTFSTATASVTVASDPATAADMNTSLAAATARIDTLNNRFAIVVDTIINHYRLVGGNQINRGRVEQVATTLRAH